MKTIFLFIFAAVLFACGGGGPSSPGGPGPHVGGVPDAVKKTWEKAGARIPLADDVKQTTAKGITIFSRAGLSQAHLDQADEALTELFADVAAGYPGQADPKSVSFAMYDVYEPEHDCIPSPVQRVPSFYVKDSALQYDESEFDQYPGAGKSVVLAPERVIGMTTAGSTITTGGATQPGRGRLLVCPDLGHWKNAIRYGAEHNVAESAGNISGESQLFLLGIANRTHSSGSGHPFIPSRAAGFVAQQKANWGEFAPIWSE